MGSTNALGIQPTLWSSRRIAAHQPWRRLSRRRKKRRGEGTHGVLLLHDIQDVIPAEGELVAILSVIVVEA